MSSAPKIRQINPEAKRAAILSAANGLFAIQGYEATSIAAIAAKADVAVGTVHRIFTGKAHLLQAAQTEIEQRLTKVMIEAWAKQAPLELRFRGMLGALFDEMINVQRLMPIMALKAETSGMPSDGHIVRSAIKQLCTSKWRMAPSAKCQFMKQPKLCLVWSIAPCAMRHPAIFMKHG